MPYHQNSAGHGGRRCETARKTEIKIILYGHQQEGHQKECADGRQHSRPQELEIGSFQGDPLMWNSLQGEKGEKLVFTLRYCCQTFPMFPETMIDVINLYSVIKYYWRVCII